MSCEITHTPLKTCFLLNNSEIHFCLTVPRAETMIGTIIPRKGRNARNSTTQGKILENKTLIMSFRGQHIFITATGHVQSLISVD